MKEPNAYVFPPETNHFKKLRREVITTDVNKVMHKVSKIFPGQPNITSHSFRVGYITQRSYGKILKILSLLNKPLVIKN